MRILIGLVTPDGGEIAIDGSPRRISDPQTAAALGIGMVHQHFSLVDELRVWENVVLGDHRRLDRRAARALVGEIGERYGLGLDPDALVSDLTAGFRQRVEIVKCLRRDPDIVIFDEPTSVLTPQESEQLFAVLRTAVTAEGKAVALVSHKLDEVLHATDVVTILRRGRVVEAMPTRDADARTLAQAMVGRPVSLRNEALALGLVEAPVVDASPANAEHSGPPALRITGAVDHEPRTGGPRRPVARRPRRRDRRHCRGRGQWPGRTRRRPRQPAFPRCRHRRGQRPRSWKPAAPERWATPESG